MKNESADEAGTARADRGTPARAVAAALALAVALSAHARPGRAEPVLRAPELIEFVEAPYPRAALDARAEGSVVLRLSLDAAGTVTEAVVHEPAGHGFDEAARDAALGFRFSPAERDGVAVPARILYTYRFALPAPALGAVAGRVFLPEPAEGPAAGVEVSVDGASAGEASARRATRTDVEGAFLLEGLSPGPRALVFDAPGVGRAGVALTVVAGETARVTVRLRADDGASPIDVTVRGETDASRLRESARAVQVIEIGEVRRQAVDLGEVLARSQGVGVRRGGGLGSGTRLSLNGLTDDQIRFFLDGVPLELAGYPSGISNVPVNLVERVDVYRGVVPIRFGADALGGALDVVTDGDVDGSRVAASYQVGSFGTHRVTVGGRHRHEPTGLFVRGAAFHDQAENDYPIQVEVPDAQGRLSETTVDRFHDAYRATGVNVEVGLVERPWAERLLLRGFVTDYEKELQHNVVMTVPYGEVEYGETSAGGSIRYAGRLADALSADLVAGYAYTETGFLDVGECVYDWFGACTRERRTPGEIDGEPSDRAQWDHTAFGRLNLAWRFRPLHELRLSVAPTYTARTGDERRPLDPTARDPLNAERDLLTLVSGLEHEVDLLGDRLESVLFVKDYVQIARSEEPLTGGGLDERDRDTHRLGAGAALRYRFVDELYAKLSYEWATRLPRPDELFGDGVLIVANLDLEPETSHNVNLSLALDAPATGVGDWRGEVNGFLREADQLIVLLGQDRVFSYQNVFSARSVGVEGALGWTSIGRFLSLDANATYVDLRNTSDEGTFGAFEGDRVPNRPYLFANGAARFELRELARPGDEAALVWNTRYVHSFYRSWESIGLRETKQELPSQLIHSLALTYVFDLSPLRIGLTAEAQNLTDEPAYDLFGVQRPGRAFFGKITAEL